MNEITCPNCNKPFKLDNAGYADIVKQVRDHQFQEELNSRLELAQNEKKSRAPNDASARARGHNRRATVAPHYHTTSLVSLLHG